MLRQTKARSPPFLFLVTVILMIYDLCMYAQSVGYAAGWSFINIFWAFTLVRTALGTGEAGFVFGLPIYLATTHLINPKEWFPHIPCLVI